MTEIICETLDDLLRRSLELVRNHGSPIRPSKGAAREVIGVSLKLTNPLARISRTEDRGVLYSALGETLWYLSGSDDFDFIEHYIPKYREACETPKDVSRSEAAYGPRLKDQMPFILNAVRKRDTRKAIISIYREADNRNKYDVPCTCTLQFFPRSGALHAVSQMRSNDIWKGMPHDVFAFTMLQELLARSVGLELGSYTHQVGSFHLYDGDAKKAESYERSGFPDIIPMPPMPSENPQVGLNWLLDVASALRHRAPLPKPHEIDGYWQDLARILRSRPLRDARNRSALAILRDEMHSDAFRTFMQDEMGKT